MLRIIPSSSGSSAAAYYTEGLKREDYYTRDQEAESLWHGKAADLLGLDGQVDPEHFAALLANKHPLTGGKLTPRQGAEKERIPGWDFNFHAPKSLSILQGLTDNQDIVQAFRESVSETMAEIEKLAATRVRRGGKQEDRITGNFLWAEFVHFTSRPVDGKPDCHLHVHAYVSNATWDFSEGRWKALKVHDIKTDAPFFEALFHSNLERKINDLGYATERSRHGWEVAGISRPMIEKYSRRSAEVKRMAESLGITDEKQKAELGAKTRKGKRHGQTASQLREEWNARLDNAERTALQRVLSQSPELKLQPKITTADAVTFAERKLLEKDSVAALREFQTEALRFGMGATSLREIEQEMIRRGMIVKNIHNSWLVTTVPVLFEEVQMIQRVRAEFGTLPPLVAGELEIGRQYLSKEQKEAVRHILKSNNQVIGLRGKAGTGKTTLLSEVREQLEAQGLRMFAFATSADASRGVLRSENFQGAETIARLLNNKELQLKIRGQVILIDEAGTVGIRDFARIQEIAGLSTKIILSGDTGQHPPVTRGDTMRLLEEYAGLPVAEVREIRRQEKAEYRRAVEALANADLKTGFERLDSMGAVIEIPGGEDRYRQLARDYHQFIEETGSPPLIVSPTHNEARSVNAAVRELLQSQGKLGLERNFLQYRQLQWAEVEKEIPENYSTGLAVKFHQNVKGIKRGSVLLVADIDASRRVWLENSDKSRIQLDLAMANRFRVFEIDQIGIAPGDLVKITDGGTAKDGRRLNNGTVYQVKGFENDGSVRLSNGLTINKDFGNLTHGYCQTSHSSQGKTAQTVFIAQSASSFLASSREGFYVSVSRGKQDVRIYTDDKVSLQQAVGNSSRRLSAIELEGIKKEEFLNGGLSGSEWTKRIAAEKSVRITAGASHAEQLSANRRLPTPEKIGSFQKYLEMRRGMLGPDGRSRSKGHPTPPDQKPQKTRGFTRPKTVEMKKSLMEKVAVPAGARKTPQPTKSAKTPSLTTIRIKHATASFKSMTKHLKEVVNRRVRTQEQPSPSKRAINFGNLKTTLAKVRSHTVQKKQIETKAIRPPQSKPKPPAPPPPTPRRK